MTTKIHITIGLSLACGLLSNCSSDKSKGELWRERTSEFQESSLDSSTKNAASKKDSAVSTVSDFDFNRFSALSDSLITIVDKGNTHFESSSRILEKGTELSQSLKPSDKSTTISYLLKANGKNPYLSVHLYRVISDNKDEMDRLFQHIKKRAFDTYSQNMEYVYSPGLTKTNDYVIRTGRQIFWLNLACAYSALNVEKMKQFLRRTIVADVIRDTIFCKCGGPCN